jgi:hypothetical protein
MKRPARFIAKLAMLLSGTFLFAEISHEGVVGGAFHGNLQGPSNQMHLSVGPLADFAIPSGLSARSLENRIPSGDSSALEASLLLDDGTYTVLNPSQVEWSFSSSNLKVNNGALFAEVMPKRTSVRVTARAEGFSVNFTVFILPNEEALVKTEPGTLPEVLRSAIELEASGWKESQWFGVFYDTENGWLYHVDHGWLHTTNGDAKTAWFWNEQQEWFWTGPNLYPHLYRDRDAAWLYFFQQALPKKVFYNHQTETLEESADR